MLTFSGFPLVILSGLLVSFIVDSFLGFSGEAGGFIGGASNTLFVVFNGSLL